LRTLQKLDAVLTERAFAEVLGLIAPSDSFTAEHRALIQKSLAATAAIEAVTAVRGENLQLDRIKLIGDPASDDKDTYAVSEKSIHSPLRVGQRIQFQRLLHADWSTTASKRWVSEANWLEGRWRVSAPRLVGHTDDFVALLTNTDVSTLAGFDFPIGLPIAYASQTDFRNFSAAIDAFGAGAWEDFYRVGDIPTEVSISRPFYPRVSSANAKQILLLNALNVHTIDELLRQCDRATPLRRAACSMFWTLGGNQVGKAAISGWREVVQPARRAGSLLWPFDGRLAELQTRCNTVICETYPAEAYRHIGVAFESAESKTRQIDRRRASSKLLNHCEESQIVMLPEMLTTLKDGFGSLSDGEDRFDATIGLFGMIEVVEGRRQEGGEDPTAKIWEGWILGQKN
jgi:hypothetical protein